MVRRLFVTSCNSEGCDTLEKYRNLVLHVVNSHGLPRSLAWLFSTAFCSGAPLSTGLFSSTSWERSRGAQSSINTGNASTNPERTLVFIIFLSSASHV